MEKIELKARYGYTHMLEQVSDNCWQLKCDPKSSGNYRCIGFPGEHFSNFPTKLSAVDPDGGPFLSVGDVIENYTITDIMSNGMIWMKKNEVSD